ncbi:MAG: hypothetical protein J0H23_00025 [Micrococcales bacterium]|nr:hypothetical protein [Micrococcales bacterium]OJX66882.1 MAG: hypothetical protein BGO94_08650 [Micrococcales bacterium 72-143]
MGPLVVGLMGLGVVTLGLVVIALKGEVASLFRRSSSFTPMPASAFAPGVARFTGVLFVLFGAGLLVLAGFLIAR